MLNLIDCKDYSNFQNIYTYINKLNSLDNYALLVTPFYNNSYLSKWIKEKKQTSSMTYTNFLLTRCIPPELKTNLFSQKLNMTEDNFYKYIELTDKDTFVELVINTNETQQVIKDNSHIIVYNSNNKYVFSLSEFKCFIDFLNKNKYSIKTNKFVQFSDLITKHKNIKVCSVPNELLNRKSFIENGKETKIVNSTTFLQNMGLLIKEYFECCDKPSVFTLSCDAITPLLKSNEKQFKNNFLGLGGEEDSLNDDLKYKEKYLKYKQKYLLLKNKL